MIGKVFFLSPGRFIGLVGCVLFNSILFLCLFVYVFVVLWLLFWFSGFYSCFLFF